MGAVYGIKEDFPKSNALIASKYRTTLTEAKIMSISLAASDRIQKNPETGYLEQKFSAAELREKLGIKGGRLYTTLAETANSMMGRVVGTKDPDKNFFEYISIITRTKYEDGVFTIEYSPHIEKYIMDLKKNFTIINLDIATGFKSIYSFRLYEFLHSFCYPKSDFEAGKVFERNFLLSELMLTLGIVNANNDKVRKILTGAKNPDFDRAVEVARKNSEHLYDSWQNLKTRALTPAIKEINETTDLYIDYKANGRGRGGKIHDITFYVKKNPNWNQVETPEILDNAEIDRDAVFDYAVDAIGLKAKDARAVCEAAGYDIEKVRDAWNYASDYSGKIENLTGFLIQAIKDGYAAEEYSPMMRRLRVVG